MKIIIIICKNSVLHSLCHPNIVQLYGVTAGSVETNVSTGKECGYFIIIDRLYGTLESKIELWNKQEDDYFHHHDNNNSSTIGGGMLLNRFFHHNNNNTSSPLILTSSSSSISTSNNNIIDYKQHKRDIFMYRIQIAIDIANAMQYIHSLNLVYRDLKPDNIGFTKNGVVKLFDFGLTRELKLIDKVTDGSNNYRLTGNTVRYIK
jgi:serine/threonine protein kinase